MTCAGVVFTTPLCSGSFPISHSRRPTPRLSPSLRFRCSTSGSEATPEKLVAGGDFTVTGGAYDFNKATTLLTNELLSSSKKVTLIRHGLSTWNAESRIQGSSDLSVLTDIGEKQAERCKKALENIHFDQCFASSISRAKHKLNQHVPNLEAADAKKIYPKEYTTWREDPANFVINGRYPLRDLWGAARDAWKEILLTPEESFLVVTHKSILRALTCTALGLDPDRFRALEVNNGGICIFNFNITGEAMLQALNMTAHMYSDHVYPPS